MKYYCGNSMKDAIANGAINIRSTKQLQAYQENYLVVIPVEDVDKDEEEHFWAIVFMRVNDNTEEVRKYDGIADYDKVRADYLYMTQETPEDFKYVVLQEITIHGGVEDIKKVSEYRKEEQRKIIMNHIAT